MVGNLVPIKDAENFDAIVNVSPVTLFTGLIDFEKTLGTGHPELSNASSDPKSLLVVRET